MATIQHYASLVKFSHTIFALPFALAGYSLAVRQTGAELQWQTLLCVVLCMFFVRNAAMSFNRYADKKYDALNVRTAGREIPRGIIKPRNALFFCILNALCFVGTTFAINKICFALSPLALLIVLGYSYTKRFTALCHFALGLGLSAAPIGAYLAMTGEWALEPMLLSLLVLLWVAGFDIIYALPDKDFDGQQRLHSIPAAVGVRCALRISAVLHVVCTALVVFIGLYLRMEVLYYVGAALFVGCLVYQHSIVAPDKLGRINLAFGTLNGIASVVFCAFFIMAMYMEAF
jgi:4-hydroxybenzoate polyprenyltransferase